jgi:DNA-binding transcriptional MerR regulator
MPTTKLTIGALSEQTHCTVPTIRYYEQIGLLPRPERTTSGHRYYRDDDLKRLTFIRRCRDFGFSIEQVRELAGLFEDGDRACAEARDLAQAHLEQVGAKLEEMRQLEISLKAFVGSCDTACNGGRTRDCVIMDEIAAPGCGTRSSATVRKPRDTLAVATGWQPDVTELKRKR